MEITYSKEEKNLGTIGPLSLIDEVEDSFLVMNGDVLTTLRYDRLFSYHQETKADLTIATHRCNTKIDLGIIE